MKKNKLDLYVSTMKMSAGKVLFGGLGVLFVIATSAHAGPYLNSAHGDSVGGVSRTGLAAKGFARGNCAHCHEQHASVDGSEPAPVTGPKGSLLFDESNTNQTTNFCFDCHGTAATIQTGGNVINRSYSYRAGGYTSDTISNIKDMYSQSSAHDLDDVVSEAAGLGWGYTAGSNACSVCHNPHIVQGDPEGSPNGKKTTARGWLITRVSQNINTNPPNLWGDVASEKMSAYAPGKYQAPYRYGSTATYEPDGSNTQDGSNLPDYNTFCTDCHNASNVIFSRSLGRNLKMIDWDNEKHGRGDADVDIQMFAPYISGTGGLGYVLSCLDCHEPHGSANIFLLRKEVNGEALSGTIGTGSAINRLCERCHDQGGGGWGSPSWEDRHHNSTDRAYDKRSCSNCHGGYPINCSNCHYHGARTGSGGVPQTTSGATNRRTF